MQVFEIDKKIEIASVWVEIVARRRAEQLKPQNLVLSAQLLDPGKMLFDDREHVLGLSTNHELVHPLTLSWIFHF